MSFDMFDSARYEFLPGVPTSFAKDKKWCSSCGRIKYRSEFYRDRSKADELQSYCKSCSVKRVMSFRKTIEGKESYVKARQRYEKSEKGRKHAQRRSYEANRDGSHRAHAMVYYAVKTGKLVRSKECAQKDLEGCSGRIVAHHHRGYAPEFYLDVIWLCNRHNVLAGSSHVL